MPPVPFSPAPAFGFLSCGHQTPCEVSPLSSERLELVQGLFSEARLHLMQAGLWPLGLEPLTVALDVALPEQVLALTVPDGAAHGLTQQAGQTVVLLNGKTAERDLEVVLHELTHVWMRSQGPQPPTPRWSLQEGQLHHESALIHEGVADAVVALLTGDPLIGEQSLGLRHATSLRVKLRCPDDITGQAHADSLLVSNLLWELAGKGQDLKAREKVLAVLKSQAPKADRDLKTFGQAIEEGLKTQAPELVDTWQALMKQSQWEQCRQPNVLNQGRLNARQGTFIAGPQAEGTPAKEAIAGPIHVQTHLEGFESVRIGLTSAQAEPTLQLKWRAYDAQGQLKGQGLSPFEGWPSLFVTVTLPQDTQTLRWSVLNPGAHDVSFNALHVAPQRTPQPLSQHPPSPESAHTGLEVVLVLGGLSVLVGGAWWTWWR